MNTNINIENVFINENKTNNLDSIIIKGLVNNNQYTYGDFVEYIKENAGSDLIVNRRESFKGLEVEHLFYINDNKNLTFWEKIYRRDKIYFLSEFFGVCGYCDEGLILFNRLLSIDFKKTIFYKHASDCTCRCCKYDIKKFVYLSIYDFINETKNIKETK